MEQRSILESPRGVERDQLLEHLRRAYTGVFDENAVERHLEDYVGFTFVDNVLPWVVARLPRRSRVLDMGSGFGSFVLAAREAGLDAYGVEVEPFEVDFARRRLAAARPQDHPENVFLLGDARSVSFAAGSFDGVTAWNVLEHVEQYEPVLAEAYSLLRPGGLLWVICPNYSAFRQEAHYYVPWRPLLTRAQAAERLRKYGKDPAYFERSIFQRTNWGVLRTLKRIGFTLFDIDGRRCMEVRLTNLHALLRHPRNFLKFYNPLRESVILSALKEVAS